MKSVIVRMEAGVHCAYLATTVSSEGTQHLKLLVKGMPRDATFAIARRISEENEYCDVVDETSIPHFRLERLIF